MNKTRNLVLVAVAGFLFACEQAPTVAAADIVLMNGKILTVDDQFSVAEALAIEGERIVAVGDTETISQRIGEETRIVELQGRTVIPGLIDNHMHFIRAAQRWNLQARIDGVNSRARALEIIAEKAATMEPGEWLMVQGGWSPGQFADQPGGFTLEELDAASPNNPLFLQLIYTTVYANSLALEAVGVSPEEGAEHRGPPLISPQPPYGLLNEQMPDVAEKQIVQNMLDFIELLNAAGVTSVYDVGRPPEGDITLLERMSADGPLPIRAWHTLKYQAYDPEGAEAAIELINSNTPNDTDEYLGLLGLGEHIYLPFFDVPPMEDVYGDDVLDPLMKVATAAAERGFSVHEHTMKDQTITSFLDRLELLDESTPLAPLRWSLAHVLNISDENIQRARDLGLTAAVHSVSMHMPPPLQPPIRALEDSGIVWGLGTDATIVAHYQPFITLGWVVTGKSINGNTLIQEPVTREEALIAHTRNNAFLLFREDDIGTLEVGKFADLVVLDRDYMTVPADEIFDISSVLTMVGGRVVYEGD
jgi:predicted amidohydrolase YtcJ